MEIRIAGIVNESVVDGPGFRYVIFSQGCNHNCIGCHNPETHDLCGGYTVSTEFLFEEIQKCRYIDGVTFSGGEPFLQAGAFAELAKKLKEKAIHILCYTGYTYEELINSKESSIRDVLENIDILIDGPYMQNKKDLSLTYRGSLNQRIINVAKSLKQNIAILEPSSKVAS